MKPANVEPQVVCILGMHRSGTSLISRIVSLLGVYLGSEDNQMRPAPDNPRGYWENQQITDINDEILTRLGGSWHELPAFSANWENAPSLADIRQKARTFLQKEFASASFWGWKDPRTCLTLPFWQNLLPRLRFIICLRNPVDVARSLEHRNGFSFAKSDYLWLSYVKSALEHTAGQPRLFLFYEDVMAAWPYALERLSNFLEQPNFAERPEIQRAIEESIDTELHHHRTSIAESVDDPSVSFYAKALYMLLRGNHPSLAESDSLEPRQGFLEAIDQFSLFALSALNEKRTLTQRVPELEQQVSQLITEKSALLGQSSQLQAALESRDKSLWDMEQRLNQLTTENSDLLGQSSQLQTALESRDKSIRDMEQRLNQLTTENSDLLGQSSQLQTALETRDKCLLASEIASREMSETLTRIYASHGWRALWLYYRIRNRMFPLGSMRRKLARLLFHAVQGSRVDLSDEEAAGNASAPSNTSALGGREAIAACTIISKNYIAFARTLADSFRKFHPDLPFFVLLVDRIDGCFRPDEEKFHLVGLDDLNIPDLQEMCFKYTILDLNTAVKPYFLSYLFDNHNIKHLVFLDPDILITENLSHLFDIIRQHAIVITPHITVPFADDRYPGDLDILQAGAYNLGFIALSDHDISRRFLGWWSEKVYDGALLAHEKGMHNDQRWVDLVPALFDDVYILKHPGYNVAYWNLHSRRIETKSRKVFVNNEPCYFFHFSGLNPADISNVSKHQDRYTIKDIGAASRLLEQYRDLVLANGHSAAKNWPYAFGQFDHGVKIPDIARRIYYTLGTKRKKFGNPFSAVSPTSFFNWLKEPVDDNWNSGPIVTRLWYELYLIRSDIKAAYPDVLGRDRSAFVSWIINSGRIEHQIDDRLIPESPQNNTHISSNGAQPAIQPKPFGINVAGYFGSEKGVGEAGRAAVRALQASAVPYVLNNVIDSGSVNSDSDLSGLSSSDNPYSINLIHVNADQVPNFTADRGVSYFSGHYNIGCWFWELSQFPEEWYVSFSSFHELWAPTSFIQDALSRVAPIPIIKMPLALSPAPELLQGMSRRNFGLSAGNFLFLSIFDFASTLERKNPLGLIQAFNKAFGKKDNVTLVLKVSHSDQYSSESETLKRACATTNVRIMDGIFSRQKLNTLLSFCDCYVSLHRSEGFGFPIAEAMTLGKPVVATAYSGNMDFTTPSNSFLIKYKILEIDRDYGPYRKGCVWAEPDVDHAAEVMRYVYENQSRAESVGQQARQDMLKFYEPRKVGQQIKERLIRLASAGKIRLPDASPYFPCKDR